MNANTSPPLQPTDVMPDASEILHYNRLGVPLYIHQSYLSRYPQMRALCHWHEDLEWIYILEGEMNFFISGKRVHLKKQDCLMVNTRQMHYGFSANKKECLFSCTIFPAHLITENPLLYNEYVLPVLKNPALEYLHFPAEDPFSEKVSASFARITQLQEQSEAGYELEVIGILCRLWRHILKKEGVLPTAVPGKDGEKTGSDLSIQRSMVSYICQHYEEKLSLDDIARAGNVGRSKCCSVFRRNLGQSPIDFLNHYRLKVSCHLLTTTDMSITQIAFACGFAHLSYYSKLFLRNYGCTPGEYRKTATPQEVI